MKRLFQWLFRGPFSRKRGSRGTAKPAAAPAARTGNPRRPAPKQAVPERQPDVVDIEPHIGGRIENAGPGKNVLIRNKYVREDTGTHDTLKILDDSLIETDEQEGIDPYNTGQFDRSKQWEKRRQ
jgi:hypothetical protein